MDKGKKSGKEPRGTTFDDVFRTVAQKIPWMMVALINEAFGTGYPLDIEAMPYRNEFITSEGKIITDMVFGICGKWYHIECQSNSDSTMEIRMIEYDFMIAHGNAVKEDGVYVVRFPESAVLYLRDRGVPDRHLVRVVMPDGKSVEYSVKSIRAQIYSKDDIFRKRLLVLVPYYLMRYERAFPGMEKDAAAREEFLADCEDLRRRLEDDPDIGDALYSDMVDLILKVSDHILAGHPKIRKGVKKTMGGKVLQLKSEKLLKKGRAEGRAEGWTKGRTKGRTEGMHQKAAAVYKNCLARGMSREDALAISEIPPSLAAKVDLAMEKK